MSDARPRSGGPTSSLPPTAFEASRMASSRAVLRVVPHGESVDALPDDAAAFVGPPASTPRVVVRFVLFLAVTVAGVWLTTVTAWDADGSFPWFWNVVWLVFPWVFLTPLWASYVRSVRRRPSDDAFRSSYRTRRPHTVATTGRVTDVRSELSDSGTLAAFVAAVGTSDGAVVVGRRAVDSTFAPHEAPVPGDVVNVWRFPDDWVVVQAARDHVRLARPADPGPEPVSTELRRLAELHRDGALTDDEYELAKRQVLGP